MQAEWGQIIPVAEIEAKLKSKKYAAMTVSHVDTATGVCAPIEEIGAMVKNTSPETIFIVDGVAATAGEFEDVDGMNIDILFTGSQKAFGVCPGMLILWASKKALAKRESMETIPEYYVDFEKWIPIMDNPSKYFATPAINLIWAMAESVRLIKEEGGLKVRCDRHLKNARAMQTALQALGFTLLAEDGYRAVTLSNLIYPAGIDDAKFRSTLMEEGIIVAAGLAAYAGKMFRIGHMGNVDINDMVAALSVVERALSKLTGKTDCLGKGVGVYMQEMMK